MIRIYSIDQKNKFYLSPYVRVIHTEDCIILCQDLFNSWVSIPCAGKVRQQILLCFENGAEEKTIMNLLYSVFFDQQRASDHLTILQQAGVLE